MVSTRVHVSAPDYAVDASFSVVRDLVSRALWGRVTVVGHPEDADLQLHIGTPDSIPQKLAKVKLVAYTFAEATRVPDVWVNHLNRCDHVWVGSEFSAAAFVASGYHGPMETIALGIECPVSAVMRATETSDSFTFMWQGTRSHQFINGEVHDGDRKRGALVEQAFRELELPNARLIMKSLPVEGRPYDIRVGNVWRVCKSLSSAEMRQLDRHVDLFVWPTMGEGFGLPPLEKLAQGVPVLVTDWSGMRDYISDFPVRSLQPSRLVQVRFNGVPAEMADIELSHLKEMMLDQYQQRDALRDIRPTLHSIASERWDFRGDMRHQMVDAIRAMCSPSSNQ